MVEVAGGDADDGKDDDARRDKDNDDNNKEDAKMEENQGSALAVPGLAAASSKSVNNWLHPDHAIHRTGKTAEF